MIRTASKLKMYHGTCTGPDDEILRSILKEGLKPDPKTKAYKSPYPEEDDEDYGFFEMDFESEVSMRLNESLGGAYLSTSPMESKKFAEHACGEHGGHPVLVSAQIESRTPEVKLDEDFLINDSFDYIVDNFFEPKSDETYYMDLIDWLYDYDYHDDPQWREIAKGWISTQFPNAKVSDYRWKQIADELGRVLHNITFITAIQEFERKAYDEAIEAGVDWGVMDSYGDVLQALDQYKDDIASVTEKFKELAEYPANKYMHNIRILKPVGYRGANRILAVVSWHRTPYHDRYTQKGFVYYARTPEDAVALLDISRVMEKYSHWESADGTIEYYDNPKPQEKAVACVVADAVYRLADTPLVGEVFAGDQHLGFVVAKNKKLLDAEAQRIYDWARQDHEMYYADEPFGELRVEHRFVGLPGVEGIIEEWYRYGEMEQTMESALAEYEEKGVLQA